MPQATDYSSRLKCLLKSQPYDPRLRVMSKEEGEREERLWGGEEERQIERERKGEIRE